MNLVPLREVAHIQLGKMLSPTAKTGRESYPYLRNQSVQWDRFELSDLAYMDFSARDREKFELRKGDLLVCEGGEPGRCAVWQGQIQNCYYQKALHRVRPIDGKADSEFLALWIRYQASTGAFEDQNAKTTIAHLPLVRLEQLLVPNLKAQTQCSIAAHLKTQLAEVDKGRQAAEAQLRDAHTLYSAVLKEIFFNEASTTWPRIELGEVGDVVAGVTLGRKKNGKATRPIPYLRVANVKDGHLDLSDVSTIEATEAEIERLLLQPGDILLTEGGDPDKLGRGTFWNGELEECIHQNHIFRVRFPSESYLPEFIAAQIGSTYGKDYFFAHAKKTTGIATINQKVLKSFPVLSPTIEVQKCVMATLNSQLVEIKMIIQSATKQLNDINLLPQKILAQAFEV